MAIHMETNVGDTDAGEIVYVTARWPHPVLKLDMMLKSKYNYGPTFDNLIGCGRRL